MPSARPGATLPPQVLTGFAGLLLEAAGVPAAHAESVAGALVEADLQGAASHGVMLLPLYLQRIAAGSVDPAASGQVVSQQAGAVVFDAQNALGQVTAARAVELAVTAARQHALGAVSVRRGFHFGMAGRWAGDIARQGCIGIVMGNTRPLMPAPGGASRVVGNNPIAIAAPGEGDPIIVDMALSAAAMGKIRLAEAAAEAIPGTWAADGDGVPTTDPAAAIAGMLLPAGGAKGFGLAMMVDILSGGLSAGAVGAEVAALYGDPATPYGCAHFFLAIDVAAFRPLAAFEAAAAAFLATIRDSRSVVGGPAVRVPGEARRERGVAAGSCFLAASTVVALHGCAEALGCAVPAELTH